MTMASVSLGIASNVIDIGLMALPAAVMVVVVIVVLVRFRKRSTFDDGPLSLEEEVEAAVELHGIRRRLEVARTRGEIRREADGLRQQMMEEMLHDRR